VAGLPRDRAGHNTEASAQAVTVVASERTTTALVRELPARDIRIPEILVTALSRVLTAWAGRDVLVELEGHGRPATIDDVDLSRTVGWFTATYPARLSRSLSTLRDVRSMLRATPADGFRYGLLRYSKLPTVDAEFATTPEVSFNYLGQWIEGRSQSQLFRPARVLDDGPALRFGRGARTHLLEINAVVIADRLRTSWTYSPHIHRPSTIEALADAYVRAVEGLVDESLTTFPRD